MLSDMEKAHPELTARNFPSAQEELQAAQPPSLYGGPESAYRLAFADSAFLLREELRPVRMQLELLKPELVQTELGIESTIVIFGSARILPRDVAERRMADADASRDPVAIRRASIVRSASTGPGLPSPRGARSFSRSRQRQRRLARRWNSRAWKPG